VSRHTILHTIETVTPGGAETVLLNLVTGLDKGRFRSIVLLPDNWWLRKKLQEHGVEMFLVESRAWYDFRLPRTIMRVIRQEKVDLIHSHLPDQNFYSCLAGSLAGCRTIATYHGPIELARAHELKQAVKLWWVRHSACAVVVVCDHVGRMLEDIGFPAAKILRIYNGIDMGWVGRTVRGTFRKERGFSEETRLVGMVANLRQSKGYEFFLQAAARVARAIPSVHFVAVGDIDEKIGGKAARLVQELSLQDRVSFLGFREDVPEILCDLDVFVLSSVSEGLPLVTLEAMAAGKPMVVTRSGGPQEIIEDGRTGSLVPPADIEALAEKICDLLRDPARAHRMGSCAQAKVKSYFTLERMVSDYERLYNRFLP